MRLIDADAMKQSMDNQAGSEIGEIILAWIDSQPTVNTAPAQHGMRLIDAGALLEKIKHRRDYVGRPSDPVCLVEDAPTIDAEPVRHGRWKEYTVPHWTKRYDSNGDPDYRNHIEYVCSICERKNIVKHKYCPNCGAKMDVDQ